MTEREEMKVKRVIAGIIKENAGPKEDGSIVIPPFAYHALVDGLFIFYDLREKDIIRRANEDKNI